MSSPQDPPGELVFVYGTLRKGAWNYSSLKGASRVARAGLRGRLVKIDWFPALLVDPQAETWVWGDVFRVQGDQLQAFLEYEGLAAGRVEGRDCRLTETKVSPAPIYEGFWKVRLWEWTGPLEEGELVTSGDWLDVERPRTPPLYTSIAGVCALALIPCSAASAAITGDLESPLFVTGLLSPAIGWVAVYWAARRRETLENLRTLVCFVLALASIPCALALVALAVLGIDYIF